MHLVQGLPVIYEDVWSCFVNYVCRGPTRILKIGVKMTPFRSSWSKYHTLVLGLFKKLESNKNVVDYSTFGVNETSVSASISITYIVNLFLTFYVS